MNKILSIKNVIRILVFILYTSYLILNTAKADAAKVSLGIFPPIIKIETMPPASIDTPITVQNLGEETVEVKAVFKPFRAKDTENGEVEYSDDYPFIFQKMQILDGLKAVDTLTLAPSQEKTLTFHIGIPKDELARDYYFSIVFVSKEIATTQGNNSNAVAGIGTNVLLSIEPKGKAKGLIEEFSAPFFLEKGPVPFTVRVKNDGENVIEPKGFILIKNVFGQTIGKVELLPVNILAGSIRAIPDSKLDARRYTLNATKAFWEEKFLLGPYTATLTLSLSDQGPQLSRSIYFFAFPLQGIIGLFVALILILIIRNRIKKQLE